MFSFVNVVFAFCFLAASNCPWLTEQQTTFTPEERTCECIRLTTICDDRSRVLNNHTAGSMRGDDTRDYCDFRCAKECEQKIKEDLGNQPVALGSEAFTKLCNEAFPNSSQNRGGICLISVPVHDRCENDNHKVLEQGICCRYCDCKIVFSDQLNGDGKLVEIRNFKDDIDNEVYNYTRWFRCSNGDNDLECEKDCRNFTASALKFPDLLNLDKTVFYVSENERATNEICKAMNERENLVTVNDPGVDVYVEMSTGNDPSNKKHFSLGSVCCERSCSCEVFYKDTKTSAVHHYFNFTSKMQKLNPGYNCNDELKQCLADCRKEVGQFFGNFELPDSTTQPEQLHIFQTYETAFEACQQIKHEYARPDGIDVSFKYSTAGYGKDAIDKSIYPYTQEFYLGRICCEMNSLNTYFPYGNKNCAVWTPDQLGKKSLK